MDQMASLVIDITREKTKKTHFSLPNNKYSRSDNFNTVFFKKVCSVVGNDMVEAISNFFTSG